MTVCHISFAPLMLLNLVQVIFLRFLVKRIILHKDIQVIDLFVSFECREMCVFVGVGGKESRMGNEEWAKWVVSLLFQEIVPRN